VEEALGVFVSTLAPADETEVGDHLSLVLLVTDLAKDGECPLEVRNRDRNAADVNESESEVVERECLCAPVTEIAHDRQRGEMLLRSLLVIALTSKLRSELVESERLAPRIGVG
jgi:hypothetical protein